MTTNPILRALNSEPINGVARRVASQRGCEEALPIELSREELIHALDRLDRKARLLKKVLKITSDAQHKKLVYAINAGKRGRPGRGMLRLTANPRGALEYKRVGEERARLCALLADRNREERAERQRVGALENAWKEANPGWIWTGVVLVAPNGSVFDRRAA